MDFKNLFFSANGRIGRQEFWIGFILLFVANFVFALIPFIGWILSLVLIWCSICVYSKRLHDMGKSGWLQLIPIVVGVVCMVLAFITGGAGIMSAAMSGNSEDPAAIAGMMAGMGMAALFLGISFLVGLVFLLWVGLSGGQAGENRFGPAPVKGGAPAAA